MAEVTYLEPTASVEELVSTLNRDGCAVVKNLASRTTIDAVKRDIEPYLARTPNAHGPFVGYSTKRTSGAFKKAPSSIGLAMDPLVLGGMDAILGPNCSRFQINLTQFISLQPGQRAQIFHRDDNMFGPHHKPFQYLINVVWAIDDFTEENGATVVAPGSHTWSEERMPEPHETCIAEMERGSALLFLGSFKHGAGANNSKRPRLGLVISYCLGWLRQYENQYLTMPPSIAKGLPDDFLRLLGYSIHEPNLGVYEGQDPLVVFSDECSDTMQARDYFSPELTARVEEYYASLENGDQSDITRAA